MKVRNGFSAIPAIVDHHPEPALTQTFLFGDDTDAGEEVAEDILVRRIGLPDPDDQIFRNEEQVHRGLRGDVAEAETEVVLVDDVARDFPVGDLLKDGFLRHGMSKSEREGKRDGTTTGEELVAIRSMRSRFSLAC